MSHRRIATLWSVWGCSLVLALALVGQLDAVALSIKPKAGDGPKRVPGQLIVKYKHGAHSAASLNKLRTKLRVRASKGLLAAGHAKPGTRFAKRAKRAAPGAVPSDLAGVAVLEVPEGTNLDLAAAELAADPNVAYAHPDVLFAAAAAPNDPFYGSVGAWGQSEEDLWGLKKVQAEGGWLLSKGQGVVIAVVDSGVDYTHPDIAANIWNNAGEVPANGVDDDGNGFIDDTRGWDFTICARFSTTGACVQSKLQDNDPADGFGHGTHVAGIAAAVGDNGLGVIGMAPRATIMPLKALNDRGEGSSSRVAAAIIYAADNGADIVNGSLACIAECPSLPVVEDAVRYAHSLGTVVILAAGNANADVALRSPQNMPESLVVSATSPTDQKLTFSNFGGNVAVAAPGGGPEGVSGVYQLAASILSLRSVTATVDPGLVVGGQYLRQPGTSMAAPHVSGLAALVLARRPAFTIAELREALQTSADDVDAAGVDVNTGHGRINAANVMRLPSMNAAPQLAAQGPYTLPEGTALVLAPLATDPDGDPLTLTWEGLPAGAVLVGDEVHWTPDDTQAGAYDITLTASDGVLEASQAIHVVVENVSRPPTLEPVGSHAVLVGETLALTFHGTDPDGDPLTYDVVPFPEGATLLGAEFSWTPTLDDVGEHHLEALVSDGDLEVSQPLQITVTAPVTSQPPVLAPVGEIVITQGKLRVVTFTATDPEQDPLTFSVDPMPAGATLTGAVFAWNPTGAQVGDYPVTVSVSDGQSSDSEAVLIRVVNTAPTIQVLDPDVTNDGAVTLADLLAAAMMFGRSNPSHDVTGDGVVNSGDMALISAHLGLLWPPTNLPEGRRLIVFVKSADPDIQPMTMAAAGMPAGATFDQPYAQNRFLRRFMWTPTGAQAGSHAVTFTAHDGAATATAALPITVRDTQAPFLPAQESGGKSN